MIYFTGGIVSRVNYEKNAGKFVVLSRDSRHGKWCTMNSLAFAMHFIKYFELTIWLREAERVLFDYTRAGVYNRTDIESVIASILRKKKSHSDIISNVSSIKTIIDY